MRTTLVIAVLLVVAFGLPGHASHGAQNGDNSDCLDWNVLYELDGVHSPLAAIVTAHPGPFTLSADGGEALIDFHDADGGYLGSAGAPGGTAPTGTVSGSICVGLTGGYPDVPAPGATWTFTQ